jgi:hypothetical protein
MIESIVILKPVTKNDVLEASYYKRLLQGEFKLGGFTAAIELLDVRLMIRSRATLTDRDSINEASLVAPINFTFRQHST